MMRLPANMCLLDAVPFSEDRYTTTSLVKVRIGDPAWEWVRVDLRCELKPEWLEDRSVVERFASTLDVWSRRVSHPNLAQVFFVEKGEEARDRGAPFASFELVWGHSLQTFVDGLAARDLKVAAAACDRIAAAIDAGLCALHRSGLAHGDVSASRVWLGMDGEVKVGLGLPWDAAAASGEDELRARALRASLETCAARRGGVVDALGDNLGALVLAVCGEPTNPLDRA